MEIKNLEINILYFLCNPINGQERDGTIRAEDIIEEFSDIPKTNVIAEIDSMTTNRLLGMDPSRSQITITENGIRRLQSSIACRIHRFDRCRCGRSP